MELKLLFMRISNNSWNLLIVPYGIETNKLREYGIAIFPFNRTLWN